jgi:hypothetical protein
VLICKAVNVAASSGVQTSITLNVNVALGRLPVDVQVTSSGFVSSMQPTFPVIVGGSGLTEIIDNCCYKQNDYRVVFLLLFLVV